MTQAPERLEPSWFEECMVQHNSGDYVLYSDYITQLAAANTERCDMHRRAQNAEGKLTRTVQLLAIIEETMRLDIASNKSWGWHSYLAKIIAAKEHAKLGSGRGFSIAYGFFSRQEDALKAELAAANARADQARDRALVEAADTFSRHESITLPRYERKPSSWRHQIYDAILALRDKPAPAVVVLTTTVQDAAKVLLDQPYSVMSAAFDAMEDLHGEGADRIMAAALRAIAGGGDE